ncbi:GUN4 domain-containing protein [Microcoleus sp. MON1_C1]|uniref:GUN4 domain-containing protein n=1 Tax=Microcoleus sp. MON1_C1 TaxID=2818827 RepID=UPI002FD793D6
MKILHIDLAVIGNEYAEVRFFWDNPNDYEPRKLPLTQISELIERSETYYYTCLPDDYAKTGQALYQWLDGSNRVLENNINQYKREGIILAIAALEKLAHLPWEILHNGQRFLVDSRPAVIPIRWVKDNNSNSLTFKEYPANRALNVLFMATSPHGIEPELDFEAEEAKILQATKRQPLCLTVEESGCLKELGYLLKDYDQNYFDVVHLTGHATFKDNKPCFITETEVGDAEFSSAEDIADEIQFQYPPLIFLSGCRTGYLRNEGVIPSMAQELLSKGAKVVLGWGDKVLDTQAAAAAGFFYQNLSAGMTVTEALACTYQALLKNLGTAVRGDWHLLRLYVTTTIPGALVKRNAIKSIPPSFTALKFLDSGGKVRVATREAFVGRRRQLQNCLRSLKINNEKIGVLIYGFGGLGKSTLAARLCERFSVAETEIIVWWQQVDETKIVKTLADKLINPDFKDLRENLRNSNEELKYRLAHLFRELGKKAEKRFLLLFDDFEWNLEHRQGKYLLKPDVAKFFSALVWAIQETSSLHRIIITCRYEFELDLLNYFHKEPLDSFRKSDLQKKLNRLPAFNSEVIDKKLIKQCLTLADGNPRLLEWLNDEVLMRGNVEAILSQLEASSDDWKGKIIWEELYQQIDEPLKQILSHCLVFKIPVPLSTLETVCESIYGCQEGLSRAIRLGLIEVSPETTGSHQLYRVSRILPHIISSIQLPPELLVYSLYGKASKNLYELWGNKKNESPEKWQEIFRLILANRENPSRFRQGFYRMLEVQYNKAADNAYEFELRQVASDLGEDNLCTQLEHYLQQGKWREADEETAWIFYQIMVKKNHQDWKKLLNNFPCKMLKEINQLWLSYSKGKFGFSIQAETYRGLIDPICSNDTISWNYMGFPRGPHCTISVYFKQEKWKNFGVRVGWNQGKEWLSYEKVMNQLRELENRKNGVLPLLLYTRLVGVGNMMEDCVEIMSRGDSYYNEMQRVLGSAGSTSVGRGFDGRGDDPAALSGRLWMIYSLVERLVTCKLVPGDCCTILNNWYY